ncbi:unnamed protein product [Orchesella dallaii]|uniref:Tubulin beta chain n=1 Tax=Orchesella dallaii TaxID=48710 RepID=A0ABP1S707_9HEXA
MKEIVTIQLGHCGNALGSQFWSDISEEHGLLPNGQYCGEHELQLSKICSFFAAGATTNYVPRSILIDLDPSSLESTRCSPTGQLFRPDNFIFGKVGAGNNFARGMYTDGVDIRDMSLEAIRKEVELCDHPSAFQMIHALGGGTGSGMGALLLEMLKEEYPKQLLLNYTVFPSSKVSEVVVEPYNTILSAPSLIKNSDVTVLLDNECLYEICQKTLQLESPLLEDLNFVMAKAMSGLSSTYRFPSRGHVDWAAMRCVMVPSRKLHFFLPAFAPINSRGVQPYRTFSVQDVLHQILNGKILLGGKEFQKSSSGGKYLTALALFRGYCLPEKEIEMNLTNFEEKNPSYFAEWMPFHFLHGTCDTPPKGMKISASFIANHTGSRNIWGRVLSKYQKMFKRKAFLHWYYSEGSGEDDFKHAEESVKELISEYKQCESRPPPGWTPPENTQGLLKRCLEEAGYDLEEKAPPKPPICP